jgi:tetratricopeptide (TPR) repeat protein
MNDIQSIEQAKLLFISGLDKLNNNDLIGAEIDFESSLKFYPSRLSTLINLSIVFIKLNKFEDAEKIFQKGLLHHPKNKELLLGLVEIYNILISYKPEYAEVYVNLGNSYKDLNMYDEALDSYNYALRLNPNLAEAYSNKGNVLQELNKYVEALESCDKAIAIRANYAEAHVNRGNALFDLSRYREAIASYDCAIEIKLDHAEAYWNKSLALLIAGEFADGWKLYEWGWESNERGINRSLLPPLWLGKEDIQDKTILLHAEQGLGDTIQFCRYAKLVKASGARVLLEAPNPLLSLLSGLEGVDQLIESGNKLPDFDYHCPLMTLPLAFKTELANIPNRTPYLAAVNNKCEKWKQKLGVKSKLNRPGF